MAALVVRDAREFLLGLVGADFILTDPPHLDTYEGPSAVAEHAAFTAEWLPLALKRAPVVLHSCGQSDDELFNYDRVAESTVALRWEPIEGAWHYFLIYGAMWPAPYDIVYSKPNPLYNVFIDRFSKRGDLVADPFCGYGEIPRAALELGRRTQGSDTNPVSIRDSFV